MSEDLKTGVTLHLWGSGLWKELAGVGGGCKQKDGWLGGSSNSLQFFRLSFSELYRPQPVCSQELSLICAEKDICRYTGYRPHCKRLVSGQKCLDATTRGSPTQLYHGKALTPFTWAKSLIRNLDHGSHNDSGS